MRPRRNHPSRFEGAHNGPMQRVDLSTRGPLQTRPRLNPDMMHVTCWCDTTMVLVDKALIGESTESCGRPHCRPPKGLEP